MRKTNEKGREQARGIDPLSLKFITGACAWRSVEPVMLTSPSLHRNETKMEGSASRTEFGGAPAPEFVGSLVRNERNRMG